MNSPSIEALLGDLFRQNVRLTVVDGKLKCSGPPEVVGSVQPMISERKTDIIQFLSTNNLGPNSAEITVEQRPAEIPLSFSQQRLWFLQEMQPETGAYNIPFALEVTGLLDLDAFRSSLNAIIARHEVFRTHFVSNAGNPSQRIVATRPLEIEEVDLRATYDLNSSDLDARIRAVAARHTAEPFDLSRDQLLRIAIYRLNDQRSIVLFTLHHIIADGWSTDILLRELCAHYRAQLLGITAELPKLPIQYVDYAIWQRRWMRGDVLEKQLDYWKNKLSGNLPTLQIQTDFPRKRVQTFPGAIKNFSISPAVTKQLQQLSQTNSASLFMTLLAAFNVLLQRYTGQLDLLVGTPVANRHRPEVEGLIGMFVNTLVIRTNVNPHASFSELLRSVRTTTLEAYEHQDLPFEKLVETLQPDRDMSLSPLFQAKFRLENESQNEVELPGLKLRRLPQEMVTAKLDLSVDMYETPSGLVGGFEYNSDLFAEDTISRMATHFVTLLESIADAPNSPIASLVFLTPEEELRQRHEWNTRDLPYQDEACFHQLFEAQVDRTPDQVAVIFDGPKREEVTYRELNERANQLAHCLQTFGIGPEEVVAISLDRSVEMVVALLGVLKSGGAYLPLDQSYPEERRRFLLEDSNAKVLVDATGVQLLCEATEVTGDVNSSQISSAPVTSFTDYDKSNPTSNVTPQNLAYLIYTSGSAGQPKGVLVPHSGLVNLTEDKIRVCDIREQDCVLQFFSFSFDGSVPEFVMTLAAGAKLLLAPATKLLPGPDLRDLLVRNEVTHITMTPSALTAVPKDDYPELRMVLVGGEAPSPELIEEWCPGRNFINAYGPTETTVNASMVSCGNGHPIEPTVLPSTNKQLYVLDDSLQLMPIGTVGELHIGGVGITRGYHRQPRLTAERYVPNPFPPNPDRKHNSPVIYKTGDLATYLPDGRIRIVGRVDAQTKIRGFRIELQEIERVLEQHKNVNVGIVRVWETATGDKRLVAYGVTRDENHESTSQVQDYLAEKLPKFMLPSAFIWLDKLPMTENGKLDEDALPTPEEAAPAEKTQPSTETEIKLAPIFAEALEIKNIGTRDNFFDLGGHSLLATRLVSRVMETFDVEITVIDLFDAPTIARLAQRIEHKQHLMYLVSADVEDETGREEISL